MVLNNQVSDLTALDGMTEFDLVKPSTVTVPRYYMTSLFKLQIESS